MLAKMKLGQNRVHLLSDVSTAPQSLTSFTRRPLHVENKNMDLSPSKFSPGFGRIRVKKSKLHRFPTVSTEKPQVAKNTLYRKLKSNKKANSCSESSLPSCVEVKAPKTINVIDKSSTPTDVENRNCCKSLSDVFDDTPKPKKTMVELIDSLAAATREKSNTPPESKLLKVPTSSTGSKSQSCSDSAMESCSRSSNSNILKNYKIPKIGETLESAKSGLCSTSASNLDTSDSLECKNLLENDKVIKIEEQSQPAKSSPCTASACKSNASDNLDCNHFKQQYRLYCKQFQSKSQEPENIDCNDDIIIVPENDVPVELSYWELKKIIKSIVSNTMLDEPNRTESLTTAQVMQRLNTLYHQDFSNRTTEIAHFLRNAKQRCLAQRDSARSVRSGLRECDLATLAPGQWLNDVVVNEYMSLIAREYPNARAVSSFFFEELERNPNRALQAVARWDGAFTILVPLCLDSHWCLLSSDVPRRKVRMYNSLAPSARELAAASVIVQHLMTCYNNFTNQETSWRFEIEQNAPVQQNDKDCGVYVCMFARKIACNLSLTIQPPIVDEFRAWMRDELVQNKLSR